MQKATAIFITACAAAGSPAAAKTAAGPRVEVHIGYDHLGTELRPTGSRADGDGVTYGLAAGYDVAIGRIVVGPEADVDFSTTYPSRPLNSTLSQTDRARARRELGASLRVGVRIGGADLVYAKVGYVNSQLDYKGAYKTIRADGDGYRLGGGFEHRLLEGLYVKGEYRYAHLGHVLSAGGAQTDRHQVLGGFGVRF